MKPLLEPKVNSNVTIIIEINTWVPCYLTLQMMIDFQKVEHNYFLNMIYNISCWKLACCWF